MVADALENERIIGMVMLSPGGSPVRGGAGRHRLVAPGSYACRSMPDGRFNVMLRGMEKFRILDERPARDGVERYRVARIESIDEAKSGATAASHAARQRLEKLLARKLQKNDHDFIPKDVPDADLVHAIAQHLEPLGSRRSWSATACRAAKCLSSCGNAHDAAG